MKTPELETISIFSKDIFLNLTINQISKELDKSYGFTNKYVRDFLSDGILTKKVVGSAILCSLNFANERTLGLLMLNSIEEKMAYLEKTDKKTRSALDEAKKIPAFKAIFISGEKIHIICEEKDRAQNYISANEKLLKNLEIKNAVLLDPNDFKLNFRNIEMKNLVIFEGYETFWRLISEMMK